MKKLVLAVSIPIVALLWMALSNEYRVRTLPDYTFAIEGYDPRDLLSGHYLNFRLKYDIGRKCSEEGRRPAYMCVHPTMKLMESATHSDCKQWITGRCWGGHFQDELTRYYVPQEKAKHLEKELLDGKASVRVSVGQGNAVIKELLIDGQSWKD